MNDLYAALGLAGPSSTSVIRRALDRMPSDDPLREAAMFVLLNARRRAAYDRTWIAEAMIGSIRNELRLDSTTLWTTSPRIPWTASESERRARGTVVRGS